MKLLKLFLNDIRLQLGFKFKGKNCPSCGHKMTWKEEILRADALFEVATACRNCKSVVVFIFMLCYNVGAKV